MIALKAAHTAVRVARDVLYDPVDLERLTCPECGADIDWKDPQRPWYCYDFPCQACGTVVTLPCHLRHRVLLLHREEGPQYPLTVPWVVRFFAAPDYSAPRWFALMFLLCILAIIAAFVRLVPHH